MTDTITVTLTKDEAFRLLHLIDYNRRMRRSSDPAISGRALIASVNENSAANKILRATDKAWPNDPIFQF
jgi:hypothetical protein